MNGYALGLIETRGKLAAIEAADVALKSANVALCDVENATGALITVKIIGDIGAVRAAVDAAKARVSLLGEIVATQVLPRPATGIMSMVKHSVMTVDLHDSAPKAADAAHPAVELLPINEEYTQVPDSSLADMPEPEESPLERSDSLPAEENDPVPNADVVQAATCNICIDPACSRKKGEPAKRCVNRKKKGS